jgi:N-acyl-L-homoserine lactone synthetase
VSARERRRFAVYGFATTHDALAAEAMLKAAGFSVVPIPAPRELGSLCGIALRLEIDEADRAEQAMTAGGTVPTAHAEIDDF